MATTCRCPCHNCCETVTCAHRNEKLYLATFAMAIVYMGSLVAVMVGSCEALGEWAGFSVATLGLTFVAVGARPSRITLPCLALHMSGRPAGWHKPAGLPSVAAGCPQRRGGHGRLKRLRLQHLRHSPRARLTVDATDMFCRSGLVGVPLRHGVHRPAL